MARKDDQTRRPGTEARSHLWSRPASEFGWLDWFAVLVLFLGLNSFREIEFSTSFGPALFKVGWAGLYAVAALALFHSFRLGWLKDTVRWLPILYLVLGIAIASPLWSLAPGLTVPRSISLVGSTIIGIFLGYQIGARRLMSVLYWTFVIFISSNVVVAILAPEFGTDDTHGASSWQGHTSNVNALGAGAAISALFCLTGILGKRLDARPTAILLLGSLGVLIMSGSVTASVATATGAAVVFGFTFLPRRHAVLAVCGLLASLAVGATILAFAVRAQHDPFVSGTSLSIVGEVVDPLGRDVSMTGRTKLWRDSIGMIEERPWSGFGYGAVWGLGSQSYLPEFPTTTGFAGDAHNGYLNLATDLGLVAAVLAMLFAAHAIMSAAAAFKIRPSPILVFAISYMFMFLVFNLTETFLFQRRLTLWFLFVALAVCSVQFLKQRRRKRNVKRPATKSREEASRPGLEPGRPEASAPSAATASEDRPRLPKTIAAARLVGSELLTRSDRERD